MASKAQKVAKLKEQTKRDPSYMAKRLKEFECFWTWPFGHRWKTVMVTWDASEVKCIHCKRIQRGPGISGQ